MLASKSLTDSLHTFCGLLNLEFSFKKFILQHTNDFIGKSKLLMQTLL